MTDEEFDQEVSDFLDELEPFVLATANELVEVCDLLYSKDDVEWPAILD